MYNSNAAIALMVLRVQIDAAHVIYLQMYVLICCSTCIQIIVENWKYYIFLQMAKHALILIVVMNTNLFLSMFTKCVYDLKLLCI